MFHASDYSGNIFCVNSKITIAGRATFGQDAGRIRRDEMNNDLAKVFRDLADGCRNAAAVWQREANNGLPGAQEMADRLMADAVRNQAKSDAFAKAA
jgi:hypothetical protein